MPQVFSLREDYRIDDIRESKTRLEASVGHSVGWTSCRNAGHYFSICFFRTDGLNCGRDSSICCQWGHWTSRIQGRICHRGCRYRCLDFSDDRYGERLRDCFGKSYGRVLPALDLRTEIRCDNLPFYELCGSPNFGRPALVPSSKLEPNRRFNGKLRLCGITDSLIVNRLR